MSRRGARDLVSRSCLYGLAFAVPLLCIVLPTGWLFLSSFVNEGALDFDAYRHALGSQRWVNLFLNTLHVAGIGTLVAALIGLPLALFLGRARVRGGNILAGLMILPLALPPYVMALTWVFSVGIRGVFTVPLEALFGVSESPLPIYGPGGAAWIAALCYAPIVILICRAGLQNVTRSAEESALLHLGPWRTLRRVTWPAIRPAFFTSLVFVFLLQLANFDVPAFLQVEVYAVAILSEFNASYDVRRATALSLPLVLTALVIVLILRHHNARVPRGTQPGDEEITLFQGRGLLIGITIAYVCTASLLPALVLLSQIGTLEQYDAMLRTAGHNILLGLQTSGIAACIMCVSGFLLAHASLHGPRKLRLWIDLSFLLTLALPPTLLGMGLIHLYNQEGFIGREIYSTPWIIIIAAVGRFLPFSVLIQRSAMQELPRTSLEAAQLMDLGFVRSLLHLYARPLVRPVLIAFFVSFIFAMGELAATQLVAPPGYTTLPIRMFTILHYGQDGMVASMAVTLMIFAAFLLLLGWLLTSPRPVPRRRETR